MLGLAVATVFAIYHAGWHNMVEVCAEKFGEAGFNPFADYDPALGISNLGWPFILINILVFLTVPFLWQPAAAFGLSAKDYKISKRIYLWSGLTFMGRGTVPILLGIAALAYFTTNEIELGPEFKSIQALPRFLALILPPVQPQK